MTLPLRAALIVAGLVLLPIPASAQGADALRARGLELSFNLDHAEALAVIQEAIAADPASLAGYRVRATILWSSTLIEQGAITAEDFTGESSSPFRSRRSNAALEQARSDLQRRTDALAAQQRGASRPDVDAIYQVGAAYRFQSGVAGTIDGSQWRGIVAARRAYLEHQRVLALDPSRKDAHDLARDDALAVVIDPDFAPLIGGRGVGVIGRQEPAAAVADSRDRARGRHAVHVDVHR
jgi:tetratricopeptide (TPR) repeat protein